MPLDKIKIPPIEPGTPSTVRKCSECKAPINVPFDLFNKLLECPFCHKGILFKRKIDQVKETVGCLGVFLVLLLAFGFLFLLSVYIERPPWRYGWSPIVTPSKSSEAAPDAITLAEQAVEAVAAEKKAVTEQKELLEKMATIVTGQSAQVNEQVKILQSRLNALTIKQQALEDLLADLRQKAIKKRN